MCIKENINKCIIDKNELNEKLKKNILIIYNQIRNGCRRNICYNIYCKNNLYCQLSKKKITFQYRLWK